MDDYQAPPNRAAVVVFVDIPDAVTEWESKGTATHNIQKILRDAGERVDHGFRIPFRYPTGEDGEMIVRSVVDLDAALRSGYVVAFPGSAPFRH